MPYNIASPKMGVHIGMLVGWKDLKSNIIIMNNVGHLSQHKQTHYCTSDVATKIPTYLTNNLQVL